MWARPEQMPPPGDWFVWFLNAGRGFGKTRSGTEWIRSRVESGAARRIAFVGKTPADVRDVMVNGPGGVLENSPPWNMPIYEPSKRSLTWPNGAQALFFSAYEPDQLRGPQFDTAWCDELGSWKYPKDTWDNLSLAVRVGFDPRICITTTPKPIKLIKEIIADPATVVTTGNTYENRDNLSPVFFKQVVRRYEGTTLGLQELYATLLDEAEGALWKRQLIEESRVDSVTGFARIVVSIDPAATNTESSDETGIIVSGVAGALDDLHAYVLEDASGRYSPNEWADIALALYDKWGADRIIAEVNNGGDMVGNTIRTRRNNISFRAVHASRGKAARAEPVVALYEQKKVHHVGFFGDLEDQLCTWEPLGDMRSPDRLDALVWGITELMIGLTLGESHVLQTVAGPVATEYNPLGLDMRDPKYRDTDR